MIRYNGKRAHRIAICGAVMAALLLGGCRPVAQSEVTTSTKEETSTEEPTTLAAEPENPEPENQETDNQETEKPEANHQKAEYYLDNSSSDYVTWEQIRNLTSDEIRIARNEIYARHGRRFNDVALQTYFDGKEWYQGTIVPEAFQESSLNEYEKYNIRYLKRAESSAGLPGHEDAPYHDLLNDYGYEDGHSALSFSLEEGTAKDCGDYYQVQAVYNRAIEAPGDLKPGDQVALVFNELTGEKRTLEYRDGSLWDVEAEYPSEYYYAPRFDGSTVVLYQDSDDRVDKPVYEGVLYIRKDAVVEIDIINQSEPVTLENLNRGSWYNGVYVDQLGYAERLVFFGD